MSIHFILALPLALLLTFLSFATNPLPAKAQCVFVTDANGANDEVGQGDLTQFCNSTIASSMMDVALSWDKINWTGQTGDACFLFNTNGDAGVNYSLCITVQSNGSGGVQLTNQPLAYSCNDRTDKPVNCFDATATNLISAVCQVSVAGTDPFFAAGVPADTGSPVGTGEAYPNDSTASCQLTFSGSLAGNSTIELSNVCAYTQAGDAGSNAKDCIARAGGGFITIVKNVTPNDVNASFVFPITGPTPKQPRLRAAAPVNASRLMRGSTP